MIKRKFAKIIFLASIELTFLCYPLFAQYNKDDVDLVRTTFTREFDRNIILRYLHSENQRKVIAGLLSVSQSQDTSFIDDIIGLEFGRYGYYISFALGQIGESTKSTGYLLSKLSLPNESTVQKNIFDALGKAGNKQTLETIINSYFQKKINNRDGISFTLANFNSRGIYSAGRNEIKVLKQEIASDPYFLTQTTEALFALSRIGPDETLSTDLVKPLYLSDFHEGSINTKLFALGSLRRLKYFPNDFPLLKELLEHTDWRIRTEALKTTCYYQFKDESELKFYLLLLQDKNPNVCRQCAISIKNITLNDSLKFFLQKDILNRLKNISLYSSNTLGELFISYTQLFPKDIFNAINRFEKVIKHKFIYNALAENFTAPKINLNFLLEELSQADNKDKIDILNALLPLQKYFPSELRLNAALLSKLSSDFPPLISTAAEGLDSSFIETNKSSLKEIINQEIKDHLNDVTYSESLISLTDLSKKIEDGFYKTILNELEKSSQYSINKFVQKEKGKQQTKIKPLGNFDDLWNNAFKYLGAKVNTNKGSFIITFNPEVAPVSVGNFCLLASKNFFNGLIFHRVVPNFVVQTGDPTGTGWGSPGYEIVSEFSPVQFDRSYVGMASAGKDTEGSQWFIMHGLFPHLNGRYSNFGKVTKGQEIVDMIDQDDYIISIELLNSPE